MNIKDLLKDAYKDGMTIEEINAALEGVELPTDNSAEIERLKNALSKRAFYFFVFLGMNGLNIRLNETDFRNDL